MNKGVFSWFVLWTLQRRAGKQRMNKNAAFTAKIISVNTDGLILSYSSKKVSKEGGPENGLSRKYLAYLYGQRSGIAKLLERTMTMLN